MKNYYARRQSKMFFLLFLFCTYQRNVLLLLLLADIKNKKNRSRPQILRLLESKPFAILIVFFALENQPLLSEFVGFKNAIKDLKIYI